MKLRWRRRHAQQYAGQGRAVSTKHTWLIIASSGDCVCRWGAASCSPSWARANTSLATSHPRQATQQPQGRRCSGALIHQHSSTCKVTTPDAHGCLQIPSTTTRPSSPCASPVAPSCGGKRWHGRCWGRGENTTGSILCSSVGGLQRCNDHTTSVGCSHHAAWPTGLPSSTPPVCLPRCRRRCRRLPCCC